jgi:hypothetical protein
MYVDERDFSLLSRGWAECMIVVEGSSFLYDEDNAVEYTALHCTSSVLRRTRC